MNIWFACEPPAVSSIASRPPSACSNLATCRLSAGCSPPRMPSVMFSFAVTAIRGPAAGADRAQNLPGEPGPILDRAAEVVGAPVPSRAQERRDQVVVTKVQFHAVETGLSEHPRSRRELADHLVDTGAGDGVHGGAGDRAGLRRTDDALAAHHADGPGMAKLRGDPRALAVHHVGDPGQAVGRPVVNVDLGRRAHAVAGDSDIGDRRHRRSARRDPAVELDQAVRHRVARAHALEGRCLQHPVAQADRPEGGRRERVRRTGSGRPDRHGRGVRSRHRSSLSRSGRLRTC